MAGWRVEADNNLVENAIRPTAIGNWQELSAVVSYVEVAPRPEFFPSDFKRMM